MTDPSIELDVDRLLGCSRAAGPRAVLGLGEGPIQPDLLEAALRTRSGLVSAAAVDEAVRRAAIDRLEAAAAALRGSMGSDGARSSRSVPPTPPSRLGGRVPPRRSPGESPTPVRPPSGPIAGRSRPVKPTARITADHLTPFDRLVLSILVAGGGWNARTRVLVAGLADQAGLDAATLRRVVVGLSGFMREQGVSGTFDQMSRAERMPTAPAPIPAPGRIEAALGRVSDTVGREFRGESRASQYRLVAIFAIIAVSFGALLVIALTAPNPEVRRIEQRRLAEERTREAMEAMREAVDPEHVIVPSVGEGMVRPAQWARPPMFRGASIPGTVVLEVERLPTVEDDLARLARDLELDPSRPAAARLAQWDAAIDALAGVWPILDAGRRAAMIRSLLDVLRRAEPPDTASRLLAVADVDPTAPITDPFDTWRRSFRAGLLGVVVLDDSLPDTVRAEARRHLEDELAGSNGRHARGGPFAALAGRALDAGVGRLVAMTGVDPDEGVADAWERWFEAQAAVRVGADLEQAYLAAIGEVLRDGRGLGVDGMSADVLGRLVEEVDWSATGADPASVREAYREWFRDGSIDGTSVWALASLLEGPRGIGWYRAPFIPDPDLGLDGRSAALARAIAAWPTSKITVANGEVVAVDADLLEQIDELLPAVRATVDAARTTTERLAAAVMAERLALATTLLVTDRTREAESEIGRVLHQLGSGDPGVDLDPATSVIRRSSDGEWTEAWKSAGRNANQQGALIDALRRDMAAGDLGPIDAATLVTEVWRGRSGVREAARGLVLEQYRQGPVISMRLLDTVGQAPMNSETVEFIEQFTGTPLPDLASDELEAAVRLALASHSLALLDPRSEVVDRLARELGAAIHARALVRFRNLGVDPPRWDGTPETAAVISADAMRREASGLFLSLASDATIEEIDLRRAGRRRLASDAVLETVAAQASELDFLAFSLEARVPGRRREIAEAMIAASLRRSEASGGIEQVARDALAIVELERVRMVPRDGDPLGGFG